MEISLAIDNYPIPGVTLPKTIDLLLCNLSIDNLHCSLPLFDTESILPPTKPLQDELTPITVFKTEYGFEIIDGYKRFFCKKRQKSTTCFCAVVKNHIGSKEAAVIRMILAKEREKSVAEKLLFFLWLQNSIAQKQLSQLAFNLGFTYKEIAWYQILSDFEESVQIPFCKGDLDLSLVSLFATFTPQDRCFFTNSFKGFRLSFQTQRELFEWLIEIAYNHGTSVEEILSDPTLQVFFIDPALNPPQKLEKIRAKLFAMRYPVLSKSKAIWEKTTSRFNPDPNRVHFSAPASFEKNRCTISILAETPEQTHSIFQKLALIEDQAWKLIIEPFNFIKKED